MAPTSGKISLNPPLLTFQSAQGSQCHRALDQIVSLQFRPHRRSLSLALAPVANIIAHI